MPLEDLGLSFRGTRLVRAHRASPAVERLETIVELAGSLVRRPLDGSKFLAADCLYGAAVFR